jgi:hypothetical protein
VDFDWSRLRRGEEIAGVSGLVLLASMFLLPWYERKVSSGPRATVVITTSVDGWHAISRGRWVLLLAILSAVALVFLQVSRRAPALPVTASVAVTIFALISVVWLIDRVLISAPGDVKVGAVVGLIAACAMLYGGYLSMREEGPAPGQDEIRIRGPT